MFPIFSIWIATVTPPANLRKSDALSLPPLDAHPPLYVLTNLALPVS